MPPELSEPIDYKRLIIRLTAHACRFLNVCQDSDHEAVVQGTGLSPADFAIQVVGMFAVGDLPHDHSKGMGGLIRHLTIAMERDILDALERAEHKRVDYIDPFASEREGDEAQEKGLADIAAAPEDPAERLDGEDLKTKVYGLVADEPKLKEMAIAVFEINALKPREIAAVCMTTTDDIQNRKKRFARLLLEQGYKSKEAGPV